MSRRAPQHTPEVKDAVSTAVTHHIALEPADWFVATWRRLEPLPRPTPAPFDPRACADRLEKAAWRRGEGLWTRAGVPVAQAREEAQFWFEAMTQVSDAVDLRQLALYLARQPYDRPLARSEIVSRLRRHYQGVTPAVVLPLAHLLQPPEVADLILGGTLGVGTRWQPESMYDRHLERALCAGLRTYLLPYLPEPGREELRALVRPHLDPEATASNTWRLPPAVLLAAALGLHAETLALVERWADNLFAARHSYHPEDEVAFVVFGLGSAELVQKHFRRLGLRLETAAQVKGWLAHTELTALDLVRDSVLACTARDTAGDLTEALCLVQAPEVAPFLLEIQLAGKAPQSARRWLDEKVGNAVAGLLPVAAGRGKLADAALEYLREARRKGHGPLLETILGAAPAEAAARIRRAVLGQAEDVFPPLDEAPEWLRPAPPPTGRGAKVPEWVGPATLPPLLLGGRRLTADQVEAVLLALRGSTLAEPAPLVRSLKEHLDRARLDAFAWALFERWLAEGAPSKDKWAFLAVGLLGGDASALKLAPLVRAWPGESCHARAVMGLECLRALGSETALMQLHGIAQKLKFKGLQAKAGAFMQAIAVERGLTPAQLEDRIVPDLDLDERGSRVLDFGPRQFRVAVGADLKPMVRDAEGKLRPDLPRPGVKDDSVKATAAVAEWKLLKKQLREVLKVQAARLGQAMVSGRRWPVADFESLVVRHPVMGILARLLLWGGWDKEGKLVRTFRVTEDRTYADVHDRECGLGGVAGVSIVHPLHLSEEERSAWGQVLGDYEVIPPFPQLGRRVHTLEPGEREATLLTRFSGPRIPAMTMVGILDRLGWVRGGSAGGGLTNEHYKIYSEAGVAAVLRYTPGVPPGYLEGWEDQEVRDCFFVSLAGADSAAWFNPGRALPLGSVDPLLMSEVLGALTVLASKGG